MLEFQSFDPAACGFPPPAVPLLPSLDWSDLAWASSDTVAPRLLEGPRVRHFARGRYALQAAYQLAGVGPSGALLAPSYHCRTMIDPALALGGSICFYPMNADLTANITDIREMLVQARGGIKALIIPHYFGFEQPVGLMQELATLCSQRAVLLVEDCSHAWQVAVNRVSECTIGAGHMVVASPYKFFGCEDGGVLWGHPEQLSTIRLRPPGVLRELKSLKDAWLRSRVSGRVIRPPHQLEHAKNRGRDGVKTTDQPSILYKSALEDRQCLALSRWIMRRTKVSAVVRQRQQHYRSWLEAIAQLPNARALFSEIASNSAPYMFPLLISRPDTQFYSLKHCGLPIWRWDEMAVSACPVAAQYRLHLLHLPCHQSLSAKQMQWMISVIAKALS